MDDLESDNFKDACARAILKMTLGPVNAKYGKKVTIVWPVERRSLGISYEVTEAVDFTRAYILLTPRQPGTYPSLHNADIIIDFLGGNLRLNTLREVISDKGINRHYFESKEIPLANPNIHEDAFKIISEIIEKALPCDEST